MTPTLLYLFGPPGAGKTTLMAALLRGWAPVHEEAGGPLPYRYLARGSATLVELGARRPPFSGTDTLSMSAGPVACAWIQERPCDRVVAEGDRLAYDGFWRAAEEAGYRLWLVCLDAPDRLLAERRVRRAKARQNPQWQAGRASKVRLLADRWDPVRLDAGRPVEELCAELQGHPFAEEFWAA